MTKTTLLWIIVSWVFLTLFNYYYVPFFILPFEWIGICFVLVISSIYQIIKLIVERKAFSNLRLQKAALFIILFMLTFFRFADKVIERADWSIFFSKRQEIVEQIKSNKLKPNVPWNGVFCQLPFRFPVISNGGNGILINAYKEKGTVTVTFWIFCNYFEAPSTQFIYTNDPDDMKLIDVKIKNNPSENWKITANWFRTEGDL